jgi:hypothetical protein
LGHVLIDVLVEIDAVGAWRKKADSDQRGQEHDDGKHAVGRKGVSNPAIVGGDAGDQKNKG